ncbi:iron ABC transporter permease [Paenibacillus psychroresistens]|uniref:Iron ABC transporter permease n=1 Tax=Paenibacillus psychroresistens TaxID=1778678 RepID=A0A6B8RUL3_9BACL|nr:iron ABC transporter permease [Paenibacillus psychroresistens]QGQ99305.1 iron ABC transporter permease [Paenibacillus psychroresistens]
MIKKLQLEKQSRKWRLLFLFSTSIVLLIIGILISLKWGAAYVSWKTLYEALTYQGHEKAHLYIQTLRLPRTLTACIVGIHLALAGLLTQLTTKNPLASPHVFGINAGASLAVVLGLVAVANFSIMDSMLFAFVGAAAGALLVWSLIGGTGQKQYVRLALAGISVHFMLSSLTEGLIILNQFSTDSMIFWLVGSVNQAAWLDVRTILPFTILGLLAFSLMLPSFRMLMMEDEIAAGLGQRVAVVRAIGMLLVIILSGSAVAICGPIGFVCLIVPHIARSLIGINLAALAPLTAVLGAVLLVYADFISRFIDFPYESPVGIVTAAIGAPFFIYLARKKGDAKS